MESISSNPVDDASSGGSEKDLGRSWIKIARDLGAAIHLLVSKIVGVELSHMGSVPAFKLNAVCGTIEFKIELITFYDVILRASS